MNLAIDGDAPIKMLIPRCDGMPKIPSAKSIANVWEPFYKRAPENRRVYVINLDRQPARWVQMTRELKQVLDWSGADLRTLTERFAAVDANQFTQDPRTRCRR